MPASGDTLRFLRELMSRGWLIGMSLSTVAEVVPSLQIFDACSKALIADYVTMLCCGVFPPFNFWRHSFGPAPLRIPLISRGGGAELGRDLRAQGVKTDSAG